MGQPGVLPGMTLGVVGAGAIGVRAAELGVAFGMRVLGMRTHAGALPPFAAMFTSAQKAEMFAQCDVLMLTLPLTPRTTGFIGAREFALMKPGTLLCNIGVGGRSIPTRCWPRCTTARWAAPAPRLPRRQPSRPTTRSGTSRTW